MGAYTISQGGGPTGNVTAVSSGVLVAASDILRKYMLIRNESDTVKVWLSIGSVSTPEAHKGIYLKPGESYEITGDNNTPAAIYAVTESGLTALLSYQIGR